MKNEGRQLVKEAVQDARSLKEAALESAKNEIVEALAPGLKAMLDRTIGKALSESADRTNSQGADYYSPPTREKHKRWEESKDKGEEPMDKDDEQKLDMESLASFFPHLSEMPDEGQEFPPQHGDEEDPMKGAKDEAGIPMLGLEGADAEQDVYGEGKDEKEEGDMDEEIEISEAELKKVYEAALQTEVQVKKGFSDVVGGGELEQAAKETGILDMKKGETHWEKEEPPASEKHIPENVQKLIKMGMAENKQLRQERNEAYRAVKTLVTKLQEVNLFNSKVLHVNRLLNKHSGLTVEQKKIAIESLDKAKSISEVKTIYEAIDGNIGAMTRNLSEGKNPRKPHANAQRARTSGAPNENVLRESVDRGNDQGNSRWKKLAGMVK